jgi:ParB-like chromosome segregation protein Spo0J
MPVYRSPEGNGRSDTDTGSETECGSGTAFPVSEWVPLEAIQPADSPRLTGEDEVHIARLASADAQLPPILVRRSDLRVIDGMHRLRVAALRGQEKIEVHFFQGSDTEAFLAAVRANVSHGLPLTTADRLAAAARIIAACPQMSDRAIAATAGLSAATVGDLRRRSTADCEQLAARVGRDGRVRPVDAAAGRARAARLLAQQPESSLRAVARAAGVSPATVRNVRDRLAQGEDPMAARPREAEEGRRPAARTHASRRVDAQEVLGRLMRDPALRQSDQGRELLRWLQNAVASSGRDPADESLNRVPPHAAPTVAELLRSCAYALEDMAARVEQCVHDEH